MKQKSNLFFLLITMIIIGSLISAIRLIAQNELSSTALILEPNVLHLFVGETVNTTIESRGFGELGLIVFPDKSVSGFFNHDNYPGQKISCAASDISGTLIDNQLEIRFFIYDTSPGCKSLDGVEETFSGLVVDNGTRILGTFSVLGQSGTWDLIRSD